MTARREILAAIQEFVPAIVRSAMITTSAHALLRDISDSEIAEIRQNGCE